MRLLIHVEGQTEETFVNEVLAPHLYTFGFTKVAARLLGRARQRRQRGGIKAWPSVRDEVAQCLYQDEGSICTLMVDYYGLPQSGSGAWPGRAKQESVVTPDQKAILLEASLQQDFLSHHGHKVTPNRFIPFVLMHEFEGLLFSDCALFAQSIGQSLLIEQLKAIRTAYPSPEDINDSPVTAPSKRLLQLIPDYQKPLHGNVGALGIGLEGIRAACPHFSSWLHRLENIQ